MAKNKNKKNEDSSAGLILLILILLGSIGYVYMYDKKQKEDDNKPKTETKKEKYSSEDYGIIYNQVKISLGSENKNIYTLLSQIETVSALELPEDLKLLYSLINLKNDNLRSDTNKRANIGEYVYSGYYVKEDTVTYLSKTLFGSECTNKTLTTYSTHYLYDAKQKVYYIYEKELKTNINKVSTYEGSYDDNYVYIDEFVAYTNTTPTPNTSYTYHNTLLPIDINEKNIKENLDIIDHFKYTFKYVESSKRYQLVKIEYIKPNE